jgi:hypothetical protein
MAKTVYRNTSYMMALQKCLEKLLQEDMVFLCGNEKARRCPNRNLRVNSAARVVISDLYTLLARPFVVASWKTVNETLEAAKEHLKQVPT